MLNLVLLAGLLAGFANLVHPRRIPWRQEWARHVEALAFKAGVPVLPLPVAVARFQRKQAVFVDARPEMEFVERHIPGAVSLPAAQFYGMPERVERLLFSGAELVFYCSGRLCDDALLVATRFKEAGYRRVALFADGLEGWVKHGFPVEESAVDR
jgi:rhodanese-related sulfurtransferase